MAANFRIRPLADRVVVKPAEREEKTRAWVKQGKTVEDLLAEFGRI